MDDSVMDRRTFVGGTAGSLLGVALGARAQPTKIPRVGFLRTDRPSQDYIDAFKGGLREKGYTPGQNIMLPCTARLPPMSRRYSRVPSPPIFRSNNPTNSKWLSTLKTAKQLGITFPRSLLLRADEVIQ
jgi:hypothetical protein